VLFEQLFQIYKENKVLTQKSKQIERKNKNIMRVWKRKLSQKLLKN